MIINGYLAIFVTLLNIISFPLLIALALLLIPFPFCTLIFGVLTQPPMSPINVIFSLWFMVTLGSLGLSLCPTKVKLELTLLTPLLSLLLNFLQHSNAFILKMVMNFYCLVSINLKEYCIIAHVLSVLNKMVLLRVNTNIFSMLHDPFFSKQIFRNIFGIYPSLMLCISLTVYHFPSFTMTHLTFCFLTNFLIILILKFLVAWLLPP